MGYVRLVQDAQVALYTSVRAVGTVHNVEGVHTARVATLSPVVSVQQAAGLAQATLAVFHAVQDTTLETELVVAPSAVQATTLGLGLLAAPNALQTHSH